MEWVLLGHVPHPRPRASPHLPQQAGPGTRPDQSSGGAKGWGGDGCLQGEVCCCTLSKVAREVVCLQE